MRLQMVDRDERHAGRQRDPLGDARAHDQPADQPGAAARADAAQRRRRHARLVQHARHQRRQMGQMRPRRDLRHHPPERAVLHLAQQRLRQHGAIGRQHARRGLVAGGLQPEHRSGSGMGAVHIVSFPRTADPIEQSDARRPAHHAASQRHARPPRPAAAGRHAGVAAGAGAEPHVHPPARPVLPGAGAGLQRHRRVPGTRHPHHRRRRAGPRLGRDRRQRTVLEGNPRGAARPADRLRGAQHEGPGDRAAARDRARLHPAARGRPRRLDPRPGHRDRRPDRSLRHAAAARRDRHHLAAPASAVAACPPGPPHQAHARQRADPASPR